MEHMEQHPATESSAHSPRGSQAVATDSALSEALEKGYEPRDISLRPVMMFIAGLTITLVVVLFAIYAIMMALADWHRSDQFVPSPVATKVPPIYAPLQPSLGFYATTREEKAARDHDVLDWQDMQAMRYQVETVLSSYGEGANGRKYEPITVAMRDVLPKLVVHPVAGIPEAQEHNYPAGSYEGVYGEKPAPPQGRYNDLHSLNDLGN